MNMSTKVFLLLSALSLAAPFCARADETPLNCEGATGHVKSVALVGTRSPTVNYEVARGFDPDPLLSTTITVPASYAVSARKLVEVPSCVVAHFSTQATPMDNFTVFQVNVDGVAMNGHVPGDAGSPAVFAPRLETPLDYSTGTTYGPSQQMLSYTFSLPVLAGTHTVQVLFAACCSLEAQTGGSVKAATLTLDYK
ncbi:MAG: hypothetical protein JWQ90_1968 [Hydrocarboniphaga sp.]|uniref:hypothetical protein n=1 Tax=Hydrocarboniphaga sp. TaxID=2033016 RepID=UPI00261C376F|nr:hypothetical protein [Hydrocarboniphaga sp.]MDB5969518.1 hypothetical protein [Hydrocarboniphaga sp.]